MNTNTGMLVRCVTSSLIVRATPNGVDFSKRLAMGQVATAFGVSFDGAWLYIVSGSTAGWVAKRFLVEVDGPDVRAEWIGAAEGNYRKGRPGSAEIDLIVIHVIEGTLKSCDHWFNNPAAGVSAHYGIGLRGELHQYVREEDTAYHAGRSHEATAELVLQRPERNPNSYSIGIEHEGTATSKWPDSMYEESARLVAEIAKRYSIPLDRTHVVGHHEIYKPKSCPGAGDVDRIVKMAKQLSL